MPQLNKTQWSDADRKKFAEMALGIESPLKQMAQLMESNNLLLKTILEPTLNEAMKSMVVGFENPLRELSQSIGKAISSMALEQLRESFKNLSSFRYPFEVIDGEYEQSDTQNSPTTETALVPQQSYVPVPISLPTQRAKMGLKEVVVGFKYKGRILKKLSHKNAEGRLLSMFLKSDNCFVADEDIYLQLNLDDGRSFSWVLRNLKNKFKKFNSLALDIERRWNPDGYIIVDIKFIN